MWVTVKLADLPEMQAVIAERDRLRAALDAALALHQWVPPVATLSGFCAACLEEDWPCRTVRALAPVADPDPHTTSDKETTT
jgi:hypothetical protein